jgi:hypothetical protein
MIGLVEIPAVFGRSVPGGPPGAAPERPPRPISLRERPSRESRIVGSASSPDQIEAREHDYENMSAVVYQRTQGWYRIGYRTDGRVLPAWVSPDEAGPFRSLPELLMNGLAYLTNEWDRMLLPEPGGVGMRIPAAEEFPHVNVIESREWQGGLWLRVELLAPGRCREPGEPPVVAWGWIPAHASSGKPNAWFFSRGC